MMLVVALILVTESIVILTQPGGSSHTPSQTAMDSPTHKVALRVNMVNSSPTHKVALMGNMVDSNHVHKVVLLGGTIDNKDIHKMVVLVGTIDSRDIHKMAVLGGTIDNRDIHKMAVLDGTTDNRHIHKVAQHIIGLRLEMVIHSHHTIKVKIKAEVKVIKEGIQINRVKTGSLREKMRKLLWYVN